MKIHLISIGGAVMHNIALELHHLGHTVSGSDDEIFEPAKSRLGAKGLLPEAAGWFPEKIDSSLDFVILGMHARADNPELLKAQELGLKIYSFPDYVYEHSKNKTRVVIGGSHGKTTTTAMIMHVLKTLGRDFDYLVGSQLEGFDTMVRFSDAPVMVIEGDEYLTSPLDRVPKFHKYHPHLAMITGIAWDHINVFPTFEGYVEQFQVFVNSIEPGGTLVFFKGDEHLNRLRIDSRKEVQVFTYEGFNTYNANGTSVIGYDGQFYTMQVFGKHNMQNMEGAAIICEQLGISMPEFLNAMQSFKGTAKRLELVSQTNTKTVYRDFAHSPSKLKATVDAVREQFPERRLIAAFELHTFSSLSENFLSEYAGSMDKADKAFVYYNAHVFEIKKMQILDRESVQQAFGDKVQVVNEADTLKSLITEAEQGAEKTVILMMSSGTFDGIDFASL